MATSLGIHLQSHGFDYVLLEGSAKKHSVKSSGGAVYRPEDLKNSKLLGKLISDTVKGGKADQVVVTLPASGVVMRELSLPFSDREKVMQVLKFEIESELYHLSFDDVMADFIELSDGRATPTLLVSVLQKDRVSAALDILGAADWDPPIITLSHGSLYTALQALPRTTTADGEQLETYLEVGSESSLLLVLNADGTLRGSRALPMGWRELTRGAFLAVAVVEPVAEEFAEGDEDEEGQDGEDASASFGDETEATKLALGGDASLPFGIGFSTALEMASEGQIQSFLTSIAKEVRRALVALGSQEGPVYLLGASIPGLEEHLQARLGREVAPLSLGMASAKGEEPNAVALGAAMRGIGVNTATMNFRQEEYRYARGLERIEGSLTLALVGLIVFFAFELAINLKVAQQYKLDSAAIFDRANSKVVVLNTKVMEDEEYPDEWIIKNNFAGVDVSEAGRISLLTSNVMKAQKQLDELMGESDLEMPPSCLEAWRLLMIFLEEEMSDYAGRWMIENFAFTSVDSNAREDGHVNVKFGITIFPDGSGSFIGRFDRLLANLKAEPWTMGSPTLPSTENAAEGGGKTGIVSVKILAGKPIGPEAGK
ncbi:MAG: hypothetical protein O3A95_08465 [Planctomycetota bacterium]|nr:hypothetical protein [Planctomycetota bacterium]MDA1114314.1 hypothetical protein [Planctomycetota bacterium]